MTKISSRNETVNVQKFTRPSEQKQRKFKYRKNVTRFYQNFTKMQVKKYRRISKNYLRMIANQKIAGK